MPMRRFGTTAARQADQRGLSGTRGYEHVALAPQATVLHGVDWRYRYNMHTLGALELAHTGAFELLQTFTLERWSSPSAVGPLRAV